jgi:glycosyltransferase involved in cell wall biosynthesis
MGMTRNKSLPVLVGHPFAPIGRGEDIRSSFRCFQRAGHGAALYDLSAAAYHSDLNLNREFATCLVRRLSPELNLYYLNGDEIEKYLDQSAGLLPVGAVNIICPQWELGIYPAEWSKQLNRFSEVWAPSLFVYQCLQRATSKPVFYLPLSVHIEFSSFLGRRHFCLPESTYLILFCFDLRSYIARKNPLAVLKAFEHVYDARSEKDIRLVIKLQGQKSSEQARIALKQFLTTVESSIARDRIIVIDNVFTDNEIKNLIRCCDCFVSLHRSEGFGRGMVEAMLLGKPVVATGYSGNLEFMNDSNSCLVRYQLIEVGRDSYPHGDAQVWADPDIEHAVSHMLRLVDDRDYGRALGRIASRHIRTHFSDRAIGLRYQRRIQEIFRGVNALERSGGTSPAQNNNQSSDTCVENKARAETHE